MTNTDLARLAADLGHAAAAVPGAAAHDVHDQAAVLEAGLRAHGQDVSAAVSYPRPLAAQIGTTKARGVYQEQPGTPVAITPAEVGHAADRLAEDLLRTGARLLKARP